MTEAAGSETPLMSKGLWVLVALGIAGITFFLLRFNDSFPAASIDLRLPKSEIVADSREWATKIGYVPENAIVSTIFAPEEEAKTFLEYELGQREANALMKDTIPVWFWRTRFCRPFEQEECAIGLLTSGKLGYVDRYLPNDQKLPSVSHKEAEQLARDFVEKSAGLSLANTKKVDDSEQKQINRVDHDFTWEEEGRDFKGAKLRVYVNVAGDKVTRFSRTLHVPERFERKFAEIRSWNNLLQSISSVVYVILSSAISFVFIWAFANGKVRWKLALTGGAINAALAILSWVDEFQALISEYPTTMAFNQYIMQSGLSTALGAVSAFVAATVFVGALEPIYRLMFPERVALEKLFTTAGLRSRKVFRSLVAGLAVFGIHTAYVVAFYLVGQRLNFWSPLEIRETATMSGQLPTFEAINVGIIASTTEELMYRVLALFFFQKLTRNFWLANFLQAASWAFMHSSYPQEPAYARGVELTIGGFFYGWVLRQFGLLACVLAHYTYDAFLGVTPLFVSQSLSDQLVAITAILPGVVALVICIFFIRSKGLLPDDNVIANSSISSSAKPPPAKPIEPAVEFPYRPLSAKTRLAVITAAMLLAAFNVLTPLQSVGENAVIKISREQAEKIAANYLSARGISTTGMHAVAFMSDQTDQTELQYVFEKEKFARTKQLAKSSEPRLIWRVRFFKELDPTEYYVTLSPDGKPEAPYVVKEESAAGVRLKPEAAKTLVSSFIAKEHPELKAPVFSDITTYDRDARTDYGIQYSVPELKVGDAEYKVYTGTVGGDVSGYSRGWKVPDKWLYERNKVSRKDEIVSVLWKVMSGIIGILGLLWFVELIKAHTMRFKAAIGLGCVGALLVLVSQLNSSVTFFVPYRTEETMRSFIMQELVQDLTGIIAAAGSTVLLAAVALGAFHKLFPQLTMPALIRPILPTGLGGSGSNRALWLDGLIVGYGFAIILAGVDHLFDFFLYKTSPAVHVLSLGSISSLADQWAPSIDVIGDAVSAMFMLPASAVIAVSFARKFIGRSFWKFMLVMLVTAAISYGTMRYWQDFSWQLVGALVMSALAYYGVLHLMRLNLLSYVFLALIATAGSGLITLIKSGYQLYFGHIAVIVVALLAPVAYTIWLYSPFMKQAPSVVSDPEASK